jgi:CheY-like chemotaxis protein
MVVDDNDDLAAALGDLLEDSVWSSFTMASPRWTGCSTSGPRSPCVIDGYDLAREIRARLGASSPFLIALTGYAQSGDAERSRDAGFDAHFVKPFDHGQLLQAIESAPNL